MSNMLILRVAVPSPLRSLFDYLPPDGCPAGSIHPGCRVRIPFGRSNAVGVIVALAESTQVPVNKLRKVTALLDEQPLFSSDLLELLKWAQSYYHHAPGDVMLGALPTALRQGGALNLKGVRRWSITPEGAAVEPESLKRAPRQQYLLQLLQTSEGGVSESQLDEPWDWRAGLRRLEEKGWVGNKVDPCLAVHQGEKQPPLALNGEQQLAVQSVTEKLGGFQPFLLDGVTGSGKTEVYLQIISEVLRLGRQVLVLLPEIGLTPQIVDRFRERFVEPVALSHSGLNESERLCAWAMAKDGKVPILIGTRSAAFTPMPNLGLIIIDEEHDASFKQQDGFRYSARDVLVKRAHQMGIPILLGSATPSLESLHNVKQGRYQLLKLTKRAGGALAPKMHLIDLRQQPMLDGFSPALMKRMKRHLERGNQVLLFLNRRGFAPTLMCHDCGWTAKCRRCDANLTFYQGKRRLLCHHCAAEQPVMMQCPGCGSIDLKPVGYGTERTEQVLHEHFPDSEILRIDRDSTRRKGALQGMLDSIHRGGNQILLGTQMLAKGHHFPNVTLVAILNADQGLFSADFRATERMAQLILQVAGRAGRAELPGEVLIQTHNPDHPLLQTLVNEGYAAFAKASMAEREAFEQPPFVQYALLRAEAVDGAAAMAFLSECLSLATTMELGQGLELLGPVPAPMERRQGRYRAQLLIQAEQRVVLHRFLQHWLPQLDRLKSGRAARWSIDVDPIEMF